MKGLEQSWDIYVSEFIKRDTKIEEIKKYLNNTYKKELVQFSIVGSEIPYNRWRNRLANEWSELANIVYIKCYKNNREESRPIIVGVTKTGKMGSIDIDLNVDINIGRKNFEISGRKFLKDNDFDFDFSRIYAISCDSPLEAFLLERAIQNEFNLFPS